MFFVKGACVRRDWKLFDHWDRNKVRSAQGQISLRLLSAVWTVCGCFVGKLSRSTGNYTRSNGYVDHTFPRVDKHFQCKYNQHFKSHITSSYYLKRVIIKPFLEHRK